MALSSWRTPSPLPKRDGRRLVTAAEAGTSVELNAQPQERTMANAAPYSAHIGYLFTELPFQKRIAAAKQHGFSAVEYPAPYDTPASEMVELLADAGLPYVQFGLRSGDAASGEKGLAIFPER